MKKIHKCQSCLLFENQKPLIQSAEQQKYSIFFIGLSAVKVSNVDEEEPFSKCTRSGALLREISNDLDSSIYFTNAVKCLPLKDNKIRYPAKSEMKACFPNLESEIKQYQPKKLVLFGKQVSKFLVSSLDAIVDDTQIVKGVVSYSTPTLSILSVPHPSYILIYKRKDIDWYINVIKEFVAK